MNRFKEVLDAFYSEQELARGSSDYAASLAWDMAVDNWDRVMKGVPWEEGVREFASAMENLSRADAANREVWETAQQYAELAS